MGNNTGYRVNDDGSVTIVRSESHGDNHNPSNNSSGNGGCIWGVIIAVVVIVCVFLFKFNNVSSQYEFANDTIAVVEEVVEEAVVIDSVVSVSTFPKSSFSDQCSRRRLDGTYSGYMLVPNFLSHSKVDDDGWMVYYADNGSYLTTVVLDYDGSAYQFIYQLANEMNSTYSTHKDDWSVDSGLYGSQIYYMKAVKSGGKYIAPHSSYQEEISPTLHYTLV